MAHSSDQASAFPKRREAHPQRSRDGGEMIANVYHLAAELQQRLGVRARRDIERQAQGSLRSWLKVSLNPPFLEYLSFRLGNQLFFILIEDADGVPRQPHRSVSCG